MNSSLRDKDVRVLCIPFSRGKNEQRKRTDATFERLRNPAPLKANSKSQFSETDSTSSFPA